MTLTLLAISAAYVVIGVLLLIMGLTSRFSWWVKAAAIVLTSVFFVEVFFATKGLLGWPGNGRLPPRFQLLWTRVVEPDPKIGDTGSIFLWVEEVDENNVPTGVPRAYRMPYSRPLAARSNRARDEIMLGNPQEGTAEDITGQETPAEMQVTAKEAPEGSRGDSTVKLEMIDLLRNAQRVEFRRMTPPLLPPKPP
jgi:hypothetical protein